MHSLQTSERFIWIWKGLLSRQRKNKSAASSKLDQMKESWATLDSEPFPSKQKQTCYDQTNDGSQTERCHCCPKVSVGFRALALAISASKTNSCNNRIFHILMLSKFFTVSSSISCWNHKTQQAGISVQH